MTSTMSTWRSNQLSYNPMTKNQWQKVFYHEWNEKARVNCEYLHNFEGKR